MYPEHNKIKARKEEHSNICEFLEWLHDKGYIIALWHKDGSSVEDYSIAPPEKLIAEYFNIDPKKFSREKDEMLRQLQTLNKDGYPAST